MSDDLDLHPATFTFGYPVWICARNGDPEAGVLGDVVTGAGKCLVVFTDEDLATRYIAAIGFATSVKAVPVPNPAIFAGLLRFMQASGHTHVAFDLPGIGNVSRVTNLIPDLLRRLQPPE